ncbi:MAG TPA: hypothetical protein VMS93_11535 [Candidatus Saccharimonadales bacterium]|nr:hypothetical protein [Candidatus Saccharimonadales bacterium]
MPSPFSPRLRFLAALALGALAALPGPARAQQWPSLHLRGFALRPPYNAEVVDTVVAHFRNADQTVFLLWDRDTLAEKVPAFGGYNVYRTVGGDTTHMELLRRYALQPARIFGNAVINPDNGSSSRMWTWRDNKLKGVGLFIDPDSIFYFDRIPFHTGQIRGGVEEIDTINVRGTMPGPKNGFELYYAVTYCDTTENGEDLTPLSANMVGPIRPTGAPVAGNLDAVKVVPNPYSFHADWDLPGRRKIRFTNLPVQVTIDIYTADGARVRTLSHSSTLDNGEDWDVKNGQGQDIGSGIYIFRLATPDGRTRVGRFTVIR